MIYFLIGIGVGIITAAAWEVVYFNKNINHKDK